ncbi:MAG TPA: hypothetical protein VNR86_11680 [Sphingomicrobium sp.]|nr:hypothetical protein [Sphingomicrobium sp.]
MRDLFMPWAGLVAGTIGAGFAHQFGADGSFDNCSRFSPLPLLIVSVACLLLVAVGGLESWRVVRGDSETPARKLVAIISVGSVALYLLAILLPMVASLVIPPCYQ